MWENLVDTLQHLIQPPYSYFCAIAVGLFLVLLLVRSYRRAHRPIIPFRAEGGDVEIAPQTIRGLVNGAALRVMGVETAHCQYFQKGRKLRIQLKIHLRASAKLTEVSTEIKRKVRHTLQTHIGMEPTDVDPIRIRVMKIIGDALPTEEPPERPTPTPAPALEVYEHAEEENENDRPRS